MDPKEVFLKAIEKFHREYMHGCPVCESTLPGFLDPRNELAIAAFKFAVLEFGWVPREP